MRNHSIPLGGHREFIDEPAACHLDFGRRDHACRNRRRDCASLIVVYRQRWLTALIDSLTSRPDMQNAVRRLMRPDDMLETFSELAVNEPDIMRLTLQASVAALVNVQSVEAVDAELKRRAVKGN